MALTYLYYRTSLTGELCQILLSEMSLPRIKVPIKKLLPNVLGRLGKEKPSKRRCKGACVQRKFSATSTVLVRFIYAPYNSQAQGHSQDWPKGGAHLEHYTRTTPKTREENLELGISRGQYPEPRGCLSPLSPPPPPA